MTDQGRAAFLWAQIATPSLQAEPPLVPGRDEARQWAAEELAKPEYAAAQPGLVEIMWRDFLKWLGSLDFRGFGTDTGNAVLVITLAAVFVIAVAIVLARPRLNARRRGEGKKRLDVDPSVTPDDYRRRAAAAAAGADWGTAVVERFRAIVRSAEERAIIDPQPGRTADEVAAALGAAFHPQAFQLRQAAAVFDSVRYGKARVGRQDLENMVGLDDALAGLRPDYGGSSSVQLVRPV